MQGRIPSNMPERNKITLIWDAAKTGTVEELHSAIEDAGAEGINTTMPSSKQDTLLHAACQYNVKHPEVALYLSDTYNLSFNRSNYDGQTSLMLAIQSGLTQVVQRFFERKDACFEPTDSHKFGFLHYCFMGGWSRDPMTREALVERGYDSEDQEEEVKLNIVELLFKYVGEHHCDCLLNEGVHHDSYNNRTILDLILMNGYKKAIHLALSKGCKYVCNPALHSSEGIKRTFLHWCVQMRKGDDYIKKVLEFVNIDETDENDETPLHYAAREKTLEPKDWRRPETHEHCDEYTRIAKLLVQNGAKINSKNKNGIAPLTFSLKEKNDAIARYLVENGADVNTCTCTSTHPGDVSLYFQECTPLLVSVDKHNHLMTTMLLSRGAKIYNSRLEFAGITHWLVLDCLLKLHRPSRTRSVSGPVQENFEKSVVTNLKDQLSEYRETHGIDVNERSDRGQTALHYCCIKVPEFREYSSKDVIKTLLDQKLIVDALDNSGYTPLMYAVKHQLYEEAAVLVKHGADCYIENQEGTSAIILAQGCGDKTQLFLKTLKKIGSVPGEENNQIVLCQTQLNRVIRMLSKKDESRDEERRNIISSLKAAEMNLQLLKNDPNMVKEMKIQNEVLDDNRVKICRILTPQYVFDKLREDGILTEHTQEEIQSEKTRLGQCQRLLDLIQRQGIFVLPSFLEALRGPICGYEWLADELTKDYERILQRIKTIDG